MNHASLTALLARSAAGDTEAFLAFYDATSSCAYGLALSRACSRGLRGTPARRAAAQETEAWYAQAWSRAAEHAEAGLSPLAWLLSFSVLEQEAACA